jgi:hypothetical protein
LLPRRDDADERSTEVQRKSVPSGSAAAPEPLPAATPQQMMRIARPGATALAAQSPAPPPLSLGAAANAAEAEEASTQLLYSFPAKISLATGHTMMVPFADREVSSARTWLYQPETAPRHPLAAVRMRNDSESGLPAGIVTAYEVAGDGSVNFVGDAELPLLPKSTFKFVTFALDAKTDIRREDKGVLSTQPGTASTALSP